MIRVQYRHYNLPINFPVIAFLGNNWVSPADRLPFNHFHNCIEVGRCNTGSGIIHTNTATYPFQAGDICILPSYSAHIMQSDVDNISSWEYILFNPLLLFPPNFATNLVADKRLFSMATNFNPIIPHDDIPECKGIYRQVDALFSEFYQKKDQYQNFTRGCLLTILSYWERLLPKLSPLELQSSHNIILILPAIQHMTSFYAERQDIPQLASLCHLSPTHFRRIFHSVLGASPLDYLNHLRINMACQLLLSQKESVKQIATNCGFTTLSSFHRIFQKVFHTTPTAWREQQLQSNQSNFILSLENEETSPIFHM